MTHEDLLMKNILFNQERRSFDRKINELNKVIENEGEKIVYLKFEHSKKIQ